MLNIKKSDDDSYTRCWNVSSCQSQSYSAQIAVVSPESQFTQIDETTQYFQLVYTLVSLIDWVKLFKSN